MCVMAFRKFFFAIVFTLLSTLSSPLLADEVPRNAFASSIRKHVLRPYEQGQWDIYMLGYGWHSPDGYSRQRRKELNQRSYGAGAGRRWVDENGHEDLLYAFAFWDSHKKIEPIAGYARQWFTSPIGGVLSLGAGFTVAVTAREDILHYVPFPIILPIVSAKVHRASLMAAILPRLGSVSKGTTVLAWGRYSF